MNNDESVLLYHAGVFGAPYGYKWSNSDNSYRKIVDDCPVLKYTQWNPLASNDEAFKLSVDLEISFLQFRDECGIGIETVFSRSDGHCNEYNGTKVYYHDCYNDKHYTARVAIVKTAAIIGGYEE